MKIPRFLPAAITALGLFAVTAWSAEPTATDPSAASATMAPAVDHVIYLAHLPAPAELVQGATAQNAKIDRMDQSSDRVVVTYSYANGRSVTFAYTLLSSIGAQEPMALSTSSQPAPMPVQSSATYVAPQPSTVVYTSPPVYYPPAYSSYYDPVWDFWAPVAIGVGLGWGWHGGGWHSGWHGGGWHGGGFRGGFGHGGGHR